MSCRGSTVGHTTGLHCTGCVEWGAGRAALATSQADVTRLVAELAESVRALAVSRAENETTLRQRGDLCGQIEDLRGDLERARGALVKIEGGWFDAPEDDLEACLSEAQAIARAFLAPPTPTASPEPDRASPEVTVKEPKSP